MNRDFIDTRDSIAEKSIVFTASKIFSSLSNIFLFIILSYLLSKPEYGTFRQVWMINKGLMEIFCFGLPISIFYFLPRLQDTEKKIFIIQSILLLSLLGISFSLLVYFFAKKIAIVFGNADLENYLRIFCLYPLFVFPTLANQSILISLERTVQYAIYIIIDRTLLAIVVGFSAFFFQTLELLLTLIIIFALLELWASIYLVVRFTRAFRIVSKKLTITRQVTFAFPSGLANVVGTINQELDKIMTASFFPVMQFAKYANGAFEIPLVGTIASSVSSVLMPEYAKRHARGDYEALLSLWHKAICKVAILFIPLMVFLFIFASDFIATLFSGKYIDSSLIFQIYLIAMLPKVTWYAPILLSMGYSREPFFGSIIALGSNLILNYLFIKSLGIIGPAIATVITTYILALYYLARISKATEVDFLHVFPWVSLSKMLFVCVLTGLCILPITCFNSISAIFRLCMGIFGYFIPIYVVFRYLSLVSKNDIEFISSFFRRARKVLIGTV